MNTSRRLELLSGLAASIIGLLILAYVLFGPLYNIASCTGGPNQQTTCTQGTATFLEVNHSLQPITIFYLAFAALALLGVGISAALHSRSGRAVWQIGLGPLPLCWRA